MTPEATSDEARPGDNEKAEPTTEPISDDPATEEPQGESPTPEEPKAERGQDATADPVTVHEAIDDPHRLGRLYLAGQNHDDWAVVRQWRLEWYRWDSTTYRLFPVEELRGELSQAIKKEFDDQNRRAVRAWEEPGKADEKGKPTPAPVARKVTGKLVSDVLQALAGMVLLPGAVDAPAWLGLGKPFPASEMLACNNTLVHLPSWADGKPARCTHTPAFFSTNALGYDFNELAPPPREWLAFLDRLWPNDPQAIEALLMWFGYCLLADISFDKILMIVGPKRSGKGTIARVLRAMIGLHNTASPTLAGLGTNFGLWPLLGKTLAIISDARLSGRTDIAAVVERLLSISGEDAQTIDRKNLPHVTTTLPVRFMILTNELPRLTDASGALVGRLVILRQTESFYGREDKSLTTKLLAELPSILLWAMSGWRLLRERGRFTEPPSSVPLVEDMEDLASPIGAFIRECCQLGPAYEVFARDLFDRWKGWCDTVGKKESGTEHSFGRDLRAALPNLDDHRPRHAGKRRIQYVGIRLRENDDAQPDEGVF